MDTLATKNEEKAKLEAEELKLQTCWQEKQDDFHTLQSNHEQESERNTKALEQVCLHCQLLTVNIE